MHQCLCLWACIYVCKIVSTICVHYETLTVQESMQHISYVVIVKKEERKCSDFITFA